MATLGTRHAQLQVSECLHLINASERIVDTLDFFPHSCPMLQLSSTDKLLMAVNDMDNALEHPHPEVPFTQVDDDSISLEQLAIFFEKKFQRPSAPELIQAPLKAAENKQPAALAPPTLTSPMQNNYPTRSQMSISENTSCDMILLPRVVTPMMVQAASQRVPERTEPPPQIYHKTIYGTWKLPTRQFHWAIIILHSNIFSHAVLHPMTGKKMKYMALMKTQTSNLFGKEALVMRQAGSSKVSTTFQAPAHVSSLSSIT
jgi:hypothetical protein